MSAIFVILIVDKQKCYVKLLIDVRNKKEVDNWHNKWRLGINNCLNVQQFFEYSR